MGHMSERYFVILGKVLPCSLQSLSVFACEGAPQHQLFSAPTSFVTGSTNNYLMSQNRLRYLSGSLESAVKSQRIEANGSCAGYAIS